MERSSTPTRTAQTYIIGTVTTDARRLSNIRIIRADRVAASSRWDAEHFLEHEADELHTPTLTCSTIA